MKEMGKAIWYCNPPSSGPASTSSLATNSSLTHVVTPRLDPRKRFSSSRPRKRTLPYESSLGNPIRNPIYLSLLHIHIHIHLLSRHPTPSPPKRNNIHHKPSNLHGRRSRAPQNHQSLSDPSSRKFTLIHATECRERGMPYI